MLKKVSFLLLLSLFSSSTQRLAGMKKESAVKINKCSFKKLYDYDNNNNMLLVVLSFLNLKNLQLLRSVNKNINSVITNLLNNKSRKKQSLVFKNKYFSDKCFKSLLNFLKKYHNCISLFKFPNSEEVGKNKLCTVFDTQKEIKVAVLSPIILLTNNQYEENKPVNINEQACPVVIAIPVPRKIINNKLCYCGIDYSEALFAHKNKVTLLFIAFKSQTIVNRLPEYAINLLEFCCNRFPNLKTLFLKESPNNQLSQMPIPTNKEIEGTIIKSNEICKKLNNVKISNNYCKLKREADKKNSNAFISLKKIATLSINKKAQTTIFTFIEQNMKNNSVLYTKVTFNAETKKFTHETKTNQN